MKVFGFLNQKGGVGKSTLLCLTALYLAEKKDAQVRIHDLDRGRDSEEFLSKAVDEKIKIYDDEESGYDYLLIDLPGGIEDEEVAAVVGICDKFIIPTGLSKNDIRRTAFTLHALNNNKSKAHILINNVRTNTKSFGAKDNVLEAFGVAYFTQPIMTRVGYEYTVASGGRNPLAPKLLKDLSAVVEEMIV